MKYDKLLMFVYSLICLHSFASRDRFCRFSFLSFAPFHPFCSVYCYRCRLFGILQVVGVIGEMSEVGKWLMMICTSFCCWNLCVLCSLCGAVIWIASSDGQFYIPMNWNMHFPEIVLCTQCVLHVPYVDVDSLVLNVWFLFQFSLIWFEVVECVRAHLCVHVCVRARISILPLLTRM